jgi:peptide/nickel transport system permease protein
VAAVEAPPDATPGPNRLRGLIAFLTGSWEARVGAGILIIFAIMAVFGTALAPFPPTEIGAGLPNEGPSAAHLLGTDGLGRDIFSRILAGAASVIVVPLIATTLAFLIGGVFGIATGYIGGRVDAVSNRVLEVLLALPPLLVVLVVIASFGSSAPVIVVSVMLVYSPRVARVLRGAAQGVATKEYIQAAQARGERRLSILLRELLPNISSVVLVEFAVRLTYVIIFVATLNFLGLGVQPPSPNWGAMLFESRVTIITNPIATIAPTVAIGALAVAIGLVADAASRHFGLDDASEIIR